LPDFVVLAKKLKPLVVNISTTQVGEGRGSHEFSSPFGDEDPFNDFWRRFFGGPAPRGPQRQRSLGSGFIIDGDGSILTNNHVVENAQKIVVKLSADDQEYEAKVIGRDPKTDIAVIKINAKTNLPAATFGDSDRLEVGEWVVAIGNPFGLDSTVTSGIVSAKGRHIGQGPYDNFIQTDASINPGSGGRSSTCAARWSASTPPFSAAPAATWALASPYPLIWSRKCCRNYAVKARSRGAFGRADSKSDTGDRREPRYGQGLWSAGR
jgi:serine protease Do